MKRYSYPFIILTTLLGVALFSACIRTGVEVHNGPRAKDYSLEVDGAEGVRVNVILIVKPRADESPTLVKATLKIPSSMRFSADTCYVWLETLPEDDGGREGDEIRANLNCNGRVIASLPLKVQHGLSNRGGMGNL